MISHFLRYKDIVLYRILASLKSEARKNYLGYIWFLLEPLLSTSVLYFAMSHLSGQRGAVAVLIILLGMVVWQWFEGSVMLSSASIAAKFHVHMQVPLPKYLFPLVDIGTNTIRFGFAFSIILISSLFFSAGINAALLWLPVLLLLQLGLIIGLSLIVSISVTLVPDLRMLVQSLFRLLFFVSGIFFTAERVPANLLPYFHANPIAVLIESYRAVLLYGRAPDIRLLGLTALVTLVMLTAGAFIQGYYDKRLMKLTNV
jgi:lipopolysaccharide transport system permease protein